MTVTPPPAFFDGKLLKGTAFELREPPSNGVQPERLRCHMNAGRSQARAVRGTPRLPELERGPTPRHVRTEAGGIAASIQWSRPRRCKPLMNSARSLSAAGTRSSKCAARQRHGARPMSSQRLARHESQSTLANAHSITHAAGCNSRSRSTLLLDETSGRNWTELRGSANQHFWSSSATAWGKSSQSPIWSKSFGQQISLPLDSVTNLGPMFVISVKQRMCGGARIGPACLRIAAADPHAHSQRCDGRLSL